MSAKITRVRLEASGDSDSSVRDCLLNAFTVISSISSIDWEEEEPGLEVQTTKKGYWGRYTVRRKTEEAKIQPED